MNDLELTSLICGGASLWVFIAAARTGDNSYVDRLWSILPVLYSWIFTGMSWLRTARLPVRGVLLSFLISIWGARLTYNFYRKGGYSGVEDYRWAVLRNKIKSNVLWIAFSFFFISFYQNYLLLFITLPVYKVSADFLTGHSALSNKDYICALAFLFFLLGESIADNQQFAFQSEKLRLRREKQVLSSDYKKGFITTGLFRYSRHPNFFCEICIWWTVYLFGSSDTGIQFHWTGVGALLLTLLFHASTDFTESISAPKYKDYLVNILS